MPKSSADEDADDDEEYHDDSFDADYNTKNSPSPAQTGARKAAAVNN